VAMRQAPASQQGDKGQEGRDGHCGSHCPHARGRRWRPV
jgi:hypothetical protein